MFSYMDSPGATIYLKTANQWHGGIGDRPTQPLRPVNLISTMNQRAAFRLSTGTMTLTRREPISLSKLMRTTPLVTPNVARGYSGRTTCDTAGVIISVINTLNYGSSSSACMDS